MKKNLAIYLIMAFGFISFPAFSQEVEIELDSRDTARNEVSLNILNLLIFGAMDVTYERVISDHSTVGAAIFSKVFNKNEGEDGDLSKAYTKDFSLTGKFKYFIKEDKNAWGLYAEAFTMFSDGNNDKDVEVIDDETGETRQVEVSLEYTDLAIGFGAGGKYITRQGFLLDLSFGLGRNLFHRDSPDIIILPTLNLGYRF